ncbi:MAG: pitrilysin family protein [Chloroflexota bacterium]|nr:pitrilysin family protein [Chloroflexota bacterium]
MYERTVLDNGLRVLTVPMPHMHSVSMAFFIGLGSRCETDDNGGAAHFIEHMLFKGTDKYPTARDLAEEIEGVGGVFNGGTGREMTLYWAKVAQFHLSVALDVLLDMLRHPRFDPVELEKERQVIIEEINSSLDMPGRWVHLLLAELIWPDHPLGRSVAGTKESVASLQRDILLESMSQYYSPSNTVLVVAGSLDHGRLLNLITASTEDWAPVDAPTYQLAVDSQREPQVRLGERDTEQAHLGISAPGLPREHPDRFVLLLMNAILGEGMSSRLFQEIRERRGLAYEIGSSVSTLQDTGAITVYAGVNPERTPTTLQAILAEWDKLRQTPVTPKELRRAKEFVKGRLALQMEDTFNVAAWVGRQELLTERILSVDEVMKKIEVVEPDDIQRLAQHLFRTEKINCAVVGPFSDDEIFREVVHL